jgi:myo-inositol catabolism protein IolS
LRYTKLGNSDLKVSVIGQGTGQFGTKTWGYGLTFNKNDVFATIRSDIEHGINTFDTAETYADGLSETLLGSALKEYNRDDVIVISKVAPWNLRRDNVIKAADATISRLGLKYIDLYLVHYPNPFIRLNETFSGLERLVAEGKVRFIGTSNFHPIQLRHAQESCKREEIVANEIEYNIVSRFSEKYTIPYCIKNKIGVICFSPLAGGVLTGRYTYGKPPNDRALLS